MEPVRAGFEGTALAQIRALAEGAGLVAAHPVAVMVEAQVWLDAPGTGDDALVDLKRLPLSTIDYPTSMDLDQAVAIEEEEGGFVVWYAIADASYYARPGTPIHAEALRRGATFYMPGLTIPMLPTVLSEGQASLLPDVDRRALVFRMRIAADGTTRGTSILRARVRSRLKTSYVAVQAFFDGGAPLSADEAVNASLRRLALVGRARIRQADSRGVVRVRRNEIAVTLADGRGMSFMALREARTDVERWNEQISLLANAEGAAALARAAGPHVHPIYRVMEPPVASRLEDLSQRIEALARMHGRDWRWRTSEPLADFLASLPDDPVAQAIHRQAMLVGGSAAYVADPGPHAGVGVELYARFTAPMREIVGVFSHRELIATLEGGHAGSDDALRDEVIASASRARSLQRDLDREINELVVDQLFADDLATGRTRTATVMGIARDKVHLTLADPPIDVKWYVAHARRQTGRELAAARDLLTLGDADGTWLKVGDAVEIRVAGYDAGAKRWELARA